MLPKELLDIEGWYREEDLEFLHRLTDYVQPSNALEVGSYRGRSAFAIALALPRDGMLYCVDLWEKIVQDAVHIDGPLALARFLSTAKNMKLQDRVSVIKESSQKADVGWNTPLDFVHLDGLHDEDDVCDDIKAWCACLGPDRVIAGHDWNNPRVYAGVLKAESRGYIKELQVLAQELLAPACDSSPAPDKLCVWTARSNRKRKVECA